MSAIVQVGGRVEAETVAAGRVVQQPVGEEFAVRAVQYVAEDQTGVGAADRVRRRRVRDPPRLRRVELGLPAVEAGRPVAEGAGEAGDRGGAAQFAQEQVAGRVVAEPDGRVGEFGHRHALGQVLLGLLRAVDQVVGRVVHALGQDLAGAVQVAQYGCRREGLEERADGEAFVGAVPDRLPRAEVVREHAYAGAVLRLQVAQAGGDVGVRRWPTRARRRPVPAGSRRSRLRW